jgi:hypothetical protein
MPDYHDDVVTQLVQGDCQRLDHIGLGIYKWHSPTTNIVFSVDSYYSSLKAANEVLIRAGLAGVIKPKRD